MNIFLKEQCFMNFMKKKQQKKHLNLDPPYQFLHLWLCTLIFFFIYVKIVHTGRSWECTAEHHFIFRLILLLVQFSEVHDWWRTSHLKGSSLCLNLLCGNVPFWNSKHRSNQNRQWWQIAHSLLPNIPAINAGSVDLCSDLPAVMLMNRNKSWQK